AAFAVFLAGGGWFAYAGVAAYATHLAWQIAQTREDVAPITALRLFRSNRDAGLLLFAGFFAQSLAFLF
ncbi:MAG: 4-hydroxybenzoate octaprenyltransferase, partial [Methylocystis sp.]|nr:4-hydroxybenzoate octaprenyltransferase [Methylocystis sp.]